MFSRTSVQHIIKPPRLQPGDTIGVISPSGPLVGERLVRLDRGLDYLRSRGYCVIEGRFLRQQTGYLAGSDEKRLADLNDMLRNSEVKAIFCSRGGYGLGRILDRIDYRTARRHPKIIVGFSDATALQLALFRRAGLVTFSGPIVAANMGEAMPPLTESSLWQMLEGKNVGLMTGVPEAPVSTIVGGTAKGRLLGGCLSVLVTLLGTRFFPNLNRAILIVEDIAEPVYKIDRYFSQLKNAGVLQQLNGLILGQFVATMPDSNPAPIGLVDMISGYVKPLGIPAVSGFSYGHVPLKYTLPFGVRARLDADAGTLSLLESGVL
jgi:muramoyltetrapeptide carboxypeptidase